MTNDGIDVISVTKNTITRSGHLFRISAAIEPSTTCLLYTSFGDILTLIFHWAACDGTILSKNLHDWICCNWLSWAWLSYDSKRQKLAVYHWLMFGRILKLRLMKLWIAPTQRCRQISQSILGINALHQKNILRSLRKRQIQNYNKRVVEMLHKIVICIITVSYTHLAVYSTKEKAKSSVSDFKRGMVQEQQSRHCLLYTSIFIWQHKVGYLNDIELII